MLCKEFIFAFGPGLYVCYWGGGEGCGCLTEASVCFYPTQFGLPGNLRRVERSHT